MEVKAEIKSSATTAVFTNTAGHPLVDNLKTFTDNRHPIWLRMYKFLNKIGLRISVEQVRCRVKAARNDKEFLTDMRKYYKTRPLTKPSAPQGAAILKRSDYRIKDILYHLDKWQNHSDLHYLDVGCSEGKITSSVAEYLKLPKERAFGVDITNQSPCPSFTFVPYNGRELPFQAGMFSFATVFMSAHHFDHPSDTFSSLRRVLGGCTPSDPRCGSGQSECKTAEGVKGSAQGSPLVVREHDVRDEATRVFLDFVHAVYMVVVGKEATAEAFAGRYIKGGFATYRSIQDWATMIASFGFQLESTTLTHDLFDSAYLTFGALRRPVTPSHLSQQPDPARETRGGASPRSPSPEEQ